MKTYRFIDLFCGIGGFRLAMQGACAETGAVANCVFSSDIDIFAQRTYEANFGERPSGDITKVAADDVPEHDLLFAGFPCQPFSIIGQKKGFEDARGTLFFDVARIIAAKRPKAFVLENVKQLAGHDGGRTLQVIKDILIDLGYDLHIQILNALDYGLPQKRERVLIVGFRSPVPFQFPEKQAQYTPLTEILEPAPDQKYYLSTRIREKRQAAHQSERQPSIWHENKSGHIHSYPYSCALRAGASYNYLTVNGERRLTPREMLRLQGFPESFIIATPGMHIRKQAGNSVPVRMIQAVLGEVLQWIK